MKVGEPYSSMNWSGNVYISMQVGEGTVGEKSVGECPFGENTWCLFFQYLSVPCCFELCAIIAFSRLKKKIWTFTMIGPVKFFDLFCQNIFLNIFCNIVCLSLRTGYEGSINYDRVLLASTIFPEFRLAKVGATVVKD